MHGSDPFEAIQSSLFTVANVRSVPTLLCPSVWGIPTSVHHCSRSLVESNREFMQAGLRFRLWSIQ